MYFKKVIKMNWEEHKKLYGLICPKCKKEFIPLADAEESIKRNGLIFDSHCSNICNLAVCRI